MADDKLNRISRIHEAIQAGLSVKFDLPELSYPPPIWKFNRCWCSIDIATGKDYSVTNIVSGNNAFLIPNK